ncbi:MAG: hypothetical protein ACPHIA_05985 [Alphaproteobacteria bacterium]
MKRLTGLIRLHRWKLEEKLRDLRELERLHDKLQTEVTNLENELAREKAAAQESPEANYAFGRYVEGAIAQQRKLKASIYEVISQIQDLEGSVAEAYRELKKYEMTETNQLRRQKRETHRREQIELDEIALNVHRRRTAN